MKKNLNQVNLKSKYFYHVPSCPLQEYPRPQLVRKSYLNLNGYWDFAMLKSTETLKEYKEKILVPFSPESILSGIGDYIVKPDDTIYYKTTFTLDKDFINKHTFLHFGAVDYECKVLINGTIVGSHKGGYVPFKFDITDFIIEGENVLEVRVTDPSDTGDQQRGKQSLNKKGIWYTPQSGIWQTVWIESLPDVFVEDITLTPDIDASLLNVKLKTTKPFNTAHIEISDGDFVMYSGSFTSDEIDVKLNGYILWTPENPKLYDLKLTIDEDEISSYFAMRKFSLCIDEDGIKRIALNNRPYFCNGVLDQGYYSDGLLTPPTEKAMYDDLMLLKKMGFNTVRKHIKIEPLLWYHYCDKLGLIVWQDMINGGGQYSFSTICAFPFIGINFKDSNYKRFKRQSEESREEYVSELKTMINYLKNVPSIGVWIPFNEGWGQFDSVKITKLIKTLDNTRIIDSVSGWHDQGKKSSELKSYHIYYRPVKFKKDKRCIVLSEFGGYSYMIKEHSSFPENPFGYKVYKDEESFYQGYKNLFEQQIIPNISKGLSATIYTQLSDVEQEINGFITYDRKKVKVDIEKIKQINSNVKL